MVAASRASTEKARFVGPESWSSKKVAVWVETLHGGMYAKYFVLSGKQLHIMWKGDVDKRVIAAEGSRGATTWRLRLLRV